MSLGPEPGEAFYDLEDDQWVRFRERNADGALVFDVHDTNNPEKEQVTMDERWATVMMKLVSYNTVHLNGDLSSRDSPVPPCPWVDTEPPSTI